MAEARRFNSCLPLLKTKDELLPNYFYLLNWYLAGAGVRQILLLPRRSAHKQFRPARPKADAIAVRRVGWAVAGLMR